MAIGLKRQDHIAFVVFMRKRPIRHVVLHRKLRLFAWRGTRLAVSLAGK